MHETPRPLKATLTRGEEKLRAREREDGRGTDASPAFFSVGVYKCVSLKKGKRRDVGPTRDVPSRFPLSQVRTPVTQDPGPAICQLFLSYFLILILVLEDRIFFSQLKFYLKFDLNSTYLLKKLTNHNFQVLLELDRNTDVYLNFI